MSQEIPMPQQEQEIADATITTWLKQPGDRIEIGDIVAEAETEKANIEIPSPVAGVLEAYLVEEGTMVKVGQAIARVR
jgi:pyruvate/2-oxoglutarate dehydrogenase complex dihydrolipoamide acyltransferase (E2) component